MYEELPLNVDITSGGDGERDRIRARLILNYETFYAVEDERHAGRCDRSSPSIRR